MTRLSLQPRVGTHLCLNTALCFLWRLHPTILFLSSICFISTVSPPPLSPSSLSSMLMSRQSSFQFSALIGFHTSSCPPSLPHLSLPLQQWLSLCLISLTPVLPSGFSALSLDPPSLLLSPLQHFPISLHDVFFFFYIPSTSWEWLKKHLNLTGNGKMMTPRSPPDLSFHANGHLSAPLCRG